MLWENLRADEFEKAVRTSEKTCIIPMGVIEKHGIHLPLGTDVMIARKVSKMVSEIEPTVIFPYYYFGQINEAKHVPGTLAYSPKLLMEILEETCDEIHRNGFEKIVLANVHGGNPSFINFFMQCTLFEKKDYAVYFVSAYPDDEEQKEALKLMNTNDNGGHAGNCETSLILAYDKNLVKMNAVEEGSEQNMRSIEEGISSPIWWYDQHPTHYSGPHNSATVEVGTMLYGIVSRRIAKQIRSIKEDNNVLEKQKEFFNSKYFK